MITLHIESRQQADAILYLLEQGIEVERLKLQVQQLTKSYTMDSYLKILHGEKVASLLIVCGLG